MKSFKRTTGQRIVDAICDIAKVIAVVVIGLVITAWVGYFLLLMIHWS